ncbi:uncharacterized protein FTOL_02780 [Fusarium torulosum]|uniref:Gfd2/YDR514C-like C-terminal domain-containing protein n=1 Tax=Fusarium torulosum TaxID=33205 RepID=A0AAE8SEY6_9HYPO|nr:uncharacterized protein FTOL_02780 [Fusarium torulosum]
MGVSSVEPASEESTRDRPVSGKSAWEEPIEESPSLKPLPRTKPARDLTLPELLEEPHLNTSPGQRTKRDLTIPELPDEPRWHNSLPKRPKRNLTVPELTEEPEWERPGMEGSQSIRSPWKLSPRDIPREEAPGRLRRRRRRMSNLRLKKSYTDESRSEEPTSVKLEAEGSPSEQPPAPISPPPSSPEDYQRIGISNLTEQEIKDLAWLKKMSGPERDDFIKEQMGWSLKIPYSKELYRGRPSNPQLWRRVVATQRLRMIMGHGVSAPTRNMWRDDLRFRLRKSNMRDVRFICIDTDKVERLPEVLEGEWKRRVTSFHLGVAILDTRDIRDVVVGSVKVPDPSKMIQTYQFAVQCDPPKYDDFLFGKTEAISLSDLRAKFVEWQVGRDVIGIAYSARNDIIVLRDFNIFMDHIFWIDLCQATYMTVREPTAPSLGILLRLLQIPNSSLHSPGNDAHFTMRALLGIAALDVTRDLESGRPIEHIPPWFDLAVKIARCPVPSPPPKPPRLRKARARTSAWKRKRERKRRPRVKVDERPAMASG